MQLPGNQDLTLEDSAVLDGAAGDLLHLGVVFDVNLLLPCTEIYCHSLNGIESKLLRKYNVMRCLTGSW